MNRYVIPTPWHAPSPAPVQPTPAPPEEVLPPVPVAVQAAQSPATAVPAVCPPETISVRSTTTAEHTWPASVTDATGGPNHMLDFVIPRGMPGPAGKNAPTPLCACFYATGCHSLLPDQPLPLTDASPLNAAGFAVAASGAVVGENGLYLVDYRVTLAPGHAGVFVLRSAQGASTVGSACCAAATPEAQAGALCAAKCLLRLTAGDCLSIVRLAQNTDTPIMTAGAVDGMEAITVSLTLLRLSD